MRPFKVDLLMIVNVVVPLLYMPKCTWSMQIYTMIFRIISTTTRNFTARHVITRWTRAGRTVLIISNIHVRILQHNSCINWSSSGDERVMNDNVKMDGQKVQIIVSFWGRETIKQIANSFQSIILFAVLAIGQYFLWDVIEKEIHLKDGQILQLW